MKLIAWFFRPLAVALLVAHLAVATETAADQSPQDQVAQPAPNEKPPEPPTPRTLNEKADGYRGIWYMNQPTGDEYAYKYSGGLGTYCDYHAPFAIYSPQANKTFFCYGGAPADDSRKLLHMVSYYDHETAQVPRPTLVVDKQTSDAHDNPVLTLDRDGFIWLYSTAHGTGRPAYIHRSRRPYDIDEFEHIVPTRRVDDGERVIDNFSYFQIFYDDTLGFRALFTRYGYPAARTACFMSSRDGVRWSEWQRLAAIEQGHYQIGAARAGKIATMLNMHPQGKGLNWRTNLYYLESLDNGATWQTVDGQPLDVPLRSADNPALVRDYQSEGLLVYVKDLQLDEKNRPVLVYSTTTGYEPGPKNGPRPLCLARWREGSWDFVEVTSSDHNYDSASLYIEPDGVWRILSPSEPGPQPYSTGGEMVLWESTDRGSTWRLKKQLTAESGRNHTYARRPVNAHADFYALWADGDALAPSESDLYFANARGRVFRLPRIMHSDFARPEPLDNSPVPTECHRRTE